MHVSQPSCVNNINEMRKMREAYSCSKRIYGGRGLKKHVNFDLAYLQLWREGIFTHIRKQIIFTVVW